MLTKAEPSRSTADALAVSEAGLLLAFQDEFRLRFGVRHAEEAQRSDQRLH